MNRKDAVKYAKRRMRSAGVRLLQHAVCILLMVVLIVGSALTFRPISALRSDDLPKNFMRTVSGFFLKNASSDDPVALQDVMKESEVKELWVPKGYEIEIINTGKRKNSFKSRVCHMGKWKGQCVFILDADETGVMYGGFINLIIRRKKKNRTGSSLRLCAFQRAKGIMTSTGTVRTKMSFIISGKLDEESLIKMAEDVMGKGINFRWSESFNN